MSYNTKFSNLKIHTLLKNVGHNVPQEAPEEFSKLIMDVNKYAKH